MKRAYKERTERKRRRNASLPPPLPPLMLTLLDMENTSETPHPSAASDGRSTARAVTVSPSVPQAGSGFPPGIMRQLLLELRTPCCLTSHLSTVGCGWDWRRQLCCVGSVAVRHRRWRQYGGGGGSGGRMAVVEAARRRRRRQRGVISSISAAGSAAAARQRCQRQLAGSAVVVVPGSATAAGMAMAAAATAVLPPRAAALAMKTPAATAMVGAQTKINNQLKSGGAAVASAAWLWRWQRGGVVSMATAAAASTY
jgi:hypothetical protein